MSRYDDCRFGVPYYLTVLPEPGMKRREFLKILSGAIWPAIWPFAARAQYPAPPYGAPPYPTSPYQAPPYQTSPYQTQQIQAAPAAANQTAAAPDDNSVGQVATLSGRATVTRANAAAIALKIADHIFESDTLQTDLNSALGVTFDDETTFSLSANTRIVVDKFVYEEGAGGNAASFHVATGTAAFVASLVAKTGDMKISTDNATLGIRGTTGVVDVPATGGANAPTIKLYPDADGHVGRIEVFDRQGGRLGALTQGASAFSIRPGASGRISAVPYQIPPQEAARDRGVLQRLNTSHAIGRQIAVQRRQTRAINRQRQNNQRPGGPQNREPNRGQNRGPGGGQQPFNRFQRGPTPGLRAPGNNKRRL
jgi:FecR protein